MKKRRLNAKQVENLRGLIRSYLRKKLTDKDGAEKVLEKIKKYGVKTMPEAIQLYKENRYILNGFE